MERMLYRPTAARLAEHIQAAYGVRVQHTSELDLGVLQVECADGSRWIARMYPSSRSIEATRGDAELLNWLADCGFPAERCATPDPVSALDGHSVLVTRLESGTRPQPGSPTFARLGRLLGQLHSLPAGCEAAARPGGAWHHLVLDSPPSEELGALSTLFHAARHRVAASEQTAYDSLARQLSNLDDCHDLPHAVVHPDFVPPNIIQVGADSWTVVDWTGAGWGPRVMSLGCLLWAASAHGAASVAAALAAYREIVPLEPEEMDRLPAAMRTRPLVLACWSFATGRAHLARAEAHWRQTERQLASALGSGREGPFV
jgi:Ser/Thr protein kinase RdoA (MazF antagonist)